MIVFPSTAAGLPSGCCEDAGIGHQHAGHPRLRDHIPSGEADPGSPQSRLQHTQSRGGACRHGGRLLQRLLRLQKHHGCL